MPKPTNKTLSKQLRAAASTIKTATAGVKKLSAGVEDLLSKIVDDTDLFDTFRNDDSLPKLVVHLGDHMGEGETIEFCDRIVEFSSKNGSNISRAHIETWLVYFSGSEAAVKKHLQDIIGP